MEMQRNEEVNRRELNLHRDAIQSIYQMLHLNEFISSASVCKSWQAAARSLSQRKDHFTSLSQDRLQSLLSSPLRHHIAVIGPANGELIRLGFEHLPQLSNGLPHLEELYCEIRFDPFKTTDLEWQFPTNLRTLAVRLNIHFDGDGAAGAAAAAASLSSLLRSIGQLQSLEELQLGFDHNSRIGYADAAILTPLVSSLKLRILGLIGPRWKLAPAHTAVIRRIPALTDFSPPNCQLDASTLAALVDSQEGLAFASRITRMPLKCDVTPAYARSFANLTAIEEFRPQLIWDDVDLSFVSSMTGVRVMELQIDESNELGPLVESLKKTSKLEVLYLNHTFLTDVHLSAFLPHLPQLQTLMIHSDVLSSLEFLANSPNLAKTLRRFELYECSSLPIKEVAFLRSLAVLERLYIVQSFQQQLDASTRDQLDPKSPSFLSSVWPNLRQFSLVQ